MTTASPKSAPTLVPPMQDADCAEGEMLCFPDGPRHGQLQDGIRAVRKRHAGTGGGGDDRPLPALGEAAGHDDDDVVRLCPLARLRQMVGVSPMKWIVFRNDTRDAHGIPPLLSVPHYNTGAHFAATDEKDVHFELYKRWKNGIIR